MTLTSARTRTSAHADLGDDWMLQQRRLHLERRDAVAERLHQVVGATAMMYVAVGVDRREVAADEPLAAINLRLLIGPVPVAEHEARVGAVHR